MSDIGLSQNAQVKRQGQNLREVVTCTCMAKDCLSIQFSARISVIAVNKMQQGKGEEGVLVTGAGMQKRS